MVKKLKQGTNAKLHTTLNKTTNTAEHGPNKKSGLE